MNRFDLKDFRASKAKTQTELAEILGISRSTVAKIEKGDIPISKKIFEKLMKYFDSDYKTIMEGYKITHLITHPFPQQSSEINTFLDNTIGINKWDNLDNEDVDYTYYYLQNMEYERLQKWLFNIVKMHTSEFKRLFDANEKKELYTCVTNTYSTSYIKQSGEIAFKKFLTEKMNLTKELIDKYLTEYYKKKTELNPEIDNLDFL